MGGFRHKPYDLMPFRVQGQVRPARSGHPPNWGITLIGWKEVPGTRLWDVIVEQEGQARTGVFHDGGQLWVDDGSEARPSWAGGARRNRRRVRRQAWSRTYSNPNFARGSAISRPTSLSSMPTQTFASGTSSLGPAVQGYPGGSQDFVSATPSTLSPSGQAVISRPSQDFLSPSGTSLSTATLSPITQDFTAAAPGVSLSPLPTQDFTSGAISDKPGLGPDTSLTLWHANEVLTGTGKYPGGTVVGNVITGAGIPELVASISAAHPDFDASDPSDVALDTIKDIFDIKPGGAVVTKPGGAVVTKPGVVLPGYDLKPGPALDTATKPDWGPSVDKYDPGEVTVPSTTKVTTPGYLPSPGYVRSSTASQPAQVLSAGKLYKQLIDPQLWRLADGGDRYAMYELQRRGPKHWRPARPNPAAATWVYWEFREGRDVMFGFSSRQDAEAFRAARGGPETVVSQDGTQLLTTIEPMPAPGLSVARPWFQPEKPPFLQVGQMAVVSDAGAVLVGPIPSAATNPARRTVRNSRARRNTTGSPQARGFTFQHADMNEPWATWAEARQGIMHRGQGYGPGSWPLGAQANPRPAAPPRSRKRSNLRPYPAYVRDLAKLHNEGFVLQENQAHPQVIRDVRAEAARQARANPRPMSQKQIRRALSRVAQANPKKRGMSPKVASFFRSDERGGGGHGGRVRRKQEAEHERRVREEDERLADRQRRKRGKKIARDLGMTEAELRAELRSMIKIRDNPWALPPMRSSSKRPGYNAFLGGGPSWPAWRSDTGWDHAKVAIQFMTRGFGSPGEYPKLIRRLARLLPPSNPATREIWAMYTRNRAKIAAKAGKRMPTLAQLKRPS